MALAAPSENMGEKLYVYLVPVIIYYVPRRFFRVMDIILIPLALGF